MKKRFKITVIDTDIKDRIYERDSSTLSSYTGGYYVIFNLKPDGTRYEEIYFPINMTVFEELGDETNIIPL